MDIEKRIEDIPFLHILIYTHILARKKIKALEHSYESLNSELRRLKEQCIKNELEKPFIIAYWNCFKRVV